MKITNLSELLEIQLQRLNIAIKSQGGHGKENILPIDCLSFLLMTPLTCFGCYEADEFTYTLLHTLLCIFSNLQNKTKQKNPAR